jgi:hypothetical protein
VGFGIGIERIACCARAHGVYCAHTSCACIWHIYTHTDTEISMFGDHSFPRMFCVSILTMRQYQRDTTVCQLYWNVVREFYWFGTRSSAFTCVLRRVKITPRLRLRPCGNYVTPQLSHFHFRLWSLISLNRSNIQHYYNQHYQSYPSTTNQPCQPTTPTQPERLLQKGNTSSLSVHPSSPLQQNKYPHPPTNPLPSRKQPRSHVLPPSQTRPLPNPLLPRRLQHLRPRPPSFRAPSSPRPAPRLPRFQNVRNFPRNRRRFET